MYTYLIYDNSGEIIDIIKTDKGEEDPYFLYINKDCNKIKVENQINDEKNWEIGKNVIEELNLYFKLKIGSIEEENKKLKNTINNLDERLKLIEDIIIDELLFSTTFGREDENINVKYQK